MLYILRFTLAAALWLVGQPGSVTQALAEVVTLSCDNLSPGGTYQIDLSRGVVIWRDPTQRGADGAPGYVETQQAQIDDQSVRWRRHFPRVCTPGGCSGYTQDFTLDRLSGTLGVLFTPYHIGGQQSHHSYSCRRVSGQKVF